MDLGAFADALDNLADDLENCPRTIAEKFAPELLDAFRAYTPKLTGARRPLRSVVWIDAKPSCAAPL